MKFSKKLRTKTMKFRGGNVVKALKELKIGRIDELIQELENVQKKMKEVRKELGSKKYESQVNNSGWRDTGRTYKKRVRGGNSSKTMVESKNAKLDELVKELEELVKKENELVNKIQMEYNELKGKKGLGMKWAPRKPK